MATEKLPSLSSLSANATDLLLPWIGAVLVAVILIMLKDLASKIAKGWAFKANKAFNEGDHVVLDGEDAVIVKIGLTETVFGIYSSKGYTWRYVPNERIQFLKLEKVVNKDLHIKQPESKD